jgi:signal transduction histidine kinase
MAEMIYHDRVVDPKKKKKYMEGILKESERLSHLIENILDFSRLEEGKKKFYFTNQSMDQLLLESITAFKNHVDPNNLTIQLIAKNKRLMVSVDKDAMMQVLNNLLDNAYKYSGDEKKIIVKSAIEDSFMKISIRDFGFGIPQDDQRKIFTRFYRGGEELTRSIRGTGIGLTIVKQIIEAHSGRIEVKSEIGKGSTFSFWIPITDN